MTEKSILMYLLILNVKDKKKSLGLIFIIGIKIEYHHSYLNKNLYKTYI
jgi:hypothetical protein